MIAMAYDADFLAGTPAGGERSRKPVTRPGGILINNSLINRL
jgi:hypothetical protein